MKSNKRSCPGFRNYPTQRRIKMINFITGVISDPAVILGLIACIGLIALRKSSSDVIKGTLETIVAFLILQQGSNIIVNSLVPFSEMFTNAVGLTGIVAEDNALVATIQTILSQEPAMRLIF